VKSFTAPHGEARAIFAGEHIAANEARSNHTRIYFRRTKARGEWVVAIPAMLITGWSLAKFFFWVLA
jgi:hypothetical protein